MQARPKILIVEDEPAQREILLYHLKKAGFEALLADNGEEGLLLAQENLPDLLILCLLALFRKLKIKNIISKLV